VGREFGEGVLGGSGGESVGRLCGERVWGESVGKEGGRGGTDRRITLFLN
jgi:hypothetical protein